MKSKLIVLRGNSGSGKSTIAKMILEELGDSKIAYIEQDHIRRIIYREKGSVDGANIGAIENLVKYSLKNNYNVILEGILHLKLHKNMLRRISKLTKQSYFFYLDIPYEETFKRHRTKKLHKEISPAKHKSWFLEDDRTNFQNEHVIDHKMSKKQIVDFILKETKLR